jgi:hypothetical protein
MVLYSGFLKKLTAAARVQVWAGSISNPNFAEIWENTNAEVSTFPEVKPFPLSRNYLRRFNEFAWDERLKIPSRQSMERHRRQNRSLTETKILRPAAKLISSFGLEELLESRLESALVSYDRSSEAFKRLKANKPDVILTTGAFQFEQPAVVAAAKKLGIPVLCLIPSWDNLSTKNRLVFKYDGYLVWSETMKQQLHEFYPQTKNVPVDIVGAPQFDVFFNTDFYQSRADFCFEQGLNPDYPIVVYALGSPNFLTEYHGAANLAERIIKGDLGNAQMLVRPHPLFDKGELSAIFDKYVPQVRLQKTVEAENIASSRSQNAAQITEWVNTFRHADVTVNLSSTVTVDAALFDCPVVNLDFDPQPGAGDQTLIKEINHSWTHFKPVAESGGVWLVNDFEELFEAVKTYLQKPDLHRAERRWIVNHVCGFADGKCGERMAESLLEFCKARKS